MGLSEIASVFARTRAQNRPALMPFWTLGYPDAETSTRVIEAIARAGADIIELGIPFSDPLADGKVVQHASQVALERGMSVSGGMQIVAELRKRGVNIPLFAMGYTNPMLAFGETRYVQAWRAAGADGIIVPDLPPEESEALGNACKANQMALVQFVAPTSTDARMALAAKHASGFIYVVQVTGVTGARDSLAEGLREYVERVKTQTGDIPVVVGFGVSTRQHVQEIGTFAHGAIVASALMRAVGAAPDPAAAAYDFVRGLIG